MKYLLLIILLTLTGCASNCTEACVFGFGPGNSTFDVVAQHYNDRDPCILKGKPEGSTRPSFCGASSGRSVRITKSIGNTYLVNVE